MNIRRTFRWLPLFLCLYATLAWPQAASPVAQSAPLVRKIEPPNWWTNFTPELTLLLIGENLNGAKVESRTTGLSVLGAEASANGHYLFVRLKLNVALGTGIAQLGLKTSTGTTNVALPILARNDARGNFERFSKDDVIYLIMPDRFADGEPANDRPPASKGEYQRSDPMSYHGGDVRGVRKHLGYLKDLGVNTLWLTPVWKNANSDYHGYHVVDMYAMDDHMGSIQDYQDLVADAHKLGMKVLMDYVANHTGPEHPWANDPPTPTWLHGSPAHHLEPAYSFTGLVDPHASPREWRATVEGWFAGKLPDLNPDDPKLGLYLAQNALWWAETAKVDGFRLDTFPYSSRQFWSGWHERVRQAFPHIDTVGEVFEHDPSVSSFFQGGRQQFDGIDSGVSTVFDYPLCFTLREVVIKGEPVQKIIDVLQRDSLYPNPEMLVTFIGNHDNKRFLSEEGSSIAKLKAGFSLLLTMRGIPQIYAGDEIGMPGGDDPDNRRDFPGGFPGDLRNAFTEAGRTPEEQDVFAHVQALLRLRQANPALREGQHKHVGWGKDYYVFVRETANEKLLVVYNNSGTAQEIVLPIGDTPLEGAHELTPLFGTGDASITDNTLHANMPGLSMSLYRVR